MSSGLVFLMSASTSESRLSPPVNMPYKIWEGKSNVFFYWKHQPEELKSKTETGSETLQKTARSLV